MTDSITYVGMDVHKNNYTVCCYNFKDDKIRYQERLNADIKTLLLYLDKVKEGYPKNTKFVCGYEAGCLGLSLYWELFAYDIKCEIIAPGSIPTQRRGHIKTDKRDAETIAKSMAYRTCKNIYIHDEDDQDVKSFLRMYDDHRKKFKKIKQHIGGFLMQYGHNYDEGSTWTKKHIKWIENIELSPVAQETLDNYMITYRYLEGRLLNLQYRMEEISNSEKYIKQVKKLECFLGIKRLTAINLVVETGDFSRFAKAEHYAAYLGIVPTEMSSGNKIIRGNITKAGNKLLRTLLIESSQAYTRGKIGFKSKTLAARQKGNSPNVIAYADKANERLRRKFYKLYCVDKKPWNVCITAIARELSCFVWGMMTENFQRENC